MKTQLKEPLKARYLLLGVLGASALVATAYASQSVAAQDAFLKIEGVEGEAQVVDDTDPSARHHNNRANPATGVAPATDGLPDYLDPDDDGDGVPTRTGSPLSSGAGEARGQAAPMGRSQTDVEDVDIIEPAQD